jgi:release factor glutamine methyltransferase
MNSSTSIAEALVAAAHRLRKAGVPEARREAGSLLAYVLGRDRSFIISHADDSITEEDLDRFRETVDWRARGKPLQYITGHQEFFGLDFEVTSDVLIPRPETELLVETALKLVDSNTAPVFCDVGTGSGCIAITLVTQIAQSRAVAVDISPAALEVAKRNAMRHAVVERVDFVLSDCFSELKAGETVFDLIVSNPPYVAERALDGLQREVRDFEPRIALQAGADGLDVVRSLLLEIGFDQHDAVRGLIDTSTWKLLDIHQDLQGIPRTVAIQKIE